MGVTKLQELGMVVKLSYCHTEGQRLPCAVVARNWSAYYDDDIDDLILAHKEAGEDVRPRDIVCADEGQAFRELRRIVQMRYPGCALRD